MVLAAFAQLRRGSGRRALHDPSLARGKEPRIGPNKRAAQEIRHSRAAVTGISHRSCKPKMADLCARREADKTIPSAQNTDIWSARLQKHDR